MPHNGLIWKISSHACENGKFNLILFYYFYKFVEKKVICGASKSLILEENKYVKLLIVDL